MEHIKPFELNLWPIFFSAVLFFATFYGCKLVRKREDQEWKSELSKIDGLADRTQDLTIQMAALGQARNFAAKGSPSERLFVYLIVRYSIVLLVYLVWCFYRMSQGQPILPL